MNTTRLVGGVSGMYDITAGLRVAHRTNMRRAVATLLAVRTLPTWAPALDRQGQRPNPFHPYRGQTVGADAMSGYGGKSSTQWAQ